MTRADPDDPIDRMVAQWAVERPDLADDLGAMATFGRLGRLTSLAGRAIEVVFEAHGLNTGEFDVLAALRRQGEPYLLTPSALARTLMLSPAGMTNRIDRLVARGLVDRRADPDDRRSLLVVLTRQGRVLIDTVVAEHVGNEQQLLGALSGTERANLDRILRKLLAQFAPPDATASAVGTQDPSG